MAVPDLLSRLLATPGPTGSEARVATVWRELAASFADVSDDRMGNTYARVRGASGGPLLALYGHVDEIGFVVTHAADEGTLAIRPIGGGISAQFLLGQRVEILAEEGPLRGVVGARRDPGRAEEKKAVEIKDLHVDAGFRDRKEALEHLRVGDLGVVAVEPLELANGRLSARSLDNRVGAYVALESVRRLAEGGGAPGDVVAVASVEEEIGDLMGARTSTFALEPDVALAIDVTSATDVPGGEPADGGELRLGGGVAILRGRSAHPRVFTLLRECAEAEGIPWSVEVPQAGTGTDVDAVYVSRGGVPSGVVSVPTRYVHTPIEMVELADVEAAVRLVVAFARALERF